MKYRIRSDSKTIDWNLTGNEKVVQNVLNIIRTRKFEIPFNRNKGISPEYIDHSISLFKADIIQDVIENIETYEPRATVVSVDIEQVNAQGELVIVVEIEV